MQYPSLVLASGSEIRARLLAQAGLCFEKRAVQLDEADARDHLLSDGASPADLAAALARLKACHPALAGERLVLGADQVLDCEGRVYSKPETPQDACAHLHRLSGRVHHLYSAAVASRRGVPVWQHVGHVRMTMHDLSSDFIAGYVRRNWDSIRHAVGCYKLEEEGVRLFSRIDGDYFSILGLPLIEFLTWLRSQGEIAT